ncbi:MAG: hypothetical protein KDH96_08270 [Candidatus Riesia sp.]|nr:hypothetical protein [Candidatus Riesia sp.]
MIQFLRNLLKKKTTIYYKASVPKLDPAISTMFARCVTYESPNRQLVALRVPIGQKATGMNHSIDHMASRQGVFVSILRLLNIDVKRAANVLKDCFKNQELRRGCKYKNNEPVEHSTQEVSGDMLIGLCFGYYHARDQLKNEMAVYATNLKKNQGMLTEGKISRVGDFHPGLQRSSTPIPIGAQTVTYLAALLCGIDAYKKIEKMLPGTKTFPALRKELEKELFKRMWLYGGFIDVMIPTAGIWFKRGYNNDNVVLQALYCCYGLCNNPLARACFGAGMLWTWGLSWPWLNGFFSGLVRNSIGFLPDRYMKACQRYAYEFINIDYSIKVTNREKARSWPVPSQMVNVGEFFPDEDQEVTKQGKPEFHSTLGQLANMVWSTQHERKNTT